MWSIRHETQSLATKKGWWAALCKSVPTAGLAGPANMTCNLPGTCRFIKSIVFLAAFVVAGLLR